MGPIGAVVVAIREGFGASLNLASALSGLPPARPRSTWTAASTVTAPRRRSASYVGATVATLVFAFLMPSPSWLSPSPERSNPTSLDDREEPIHRGVVVTARARLDRAVLHELPCEPTTAQRQSPCSFEAGRALLHHHHRATRLVPSRRRAPLK